MARDTVRPQSQDAGDSFGRLPSTARSVPPAYDSMRLHSNQSDAMGYAIHGERRVVDEEAAHGLADLGNASSSSNVSREAGASSGQGQQQHEQGQGQEGSWGQSGWEPAGDQQQYQLGQKRPAASIDTTSAAFASDEGRGPPSSSKHSRTEEQGRAA